MKLEFGKPVKPDKSKSPPTPKTENPNPSYGRCSTCGCGGPFTLHPRGAKWLRKCTCGEVFDVDTLTVIQKGEIKNATRPLGNMESDAR